MLQTIALLLYEFFFVGLLAVGGGLATIPFLQSIGRRRPGWYSGAQLANIIAAAQCVPGPLGTNMAAYVGRAVGGIAGALLCPLALMAPTVLVDIAAVKLMERFRQNALLEQSMLVLRPASAGLICAAALSLLRISLIDAQGFDWRCAALYLLLLPFAFWKKKKLHPHAVELDAELPKIAAPA
jgi:chromate transporter